MKQVLFLMSMGLRNACRVYVVPSGSPGPVNVSGVTSSSVTVQWGEVDCIQSNGNVTGYSVRVEAVGSGYRDTVNVSGSNTTSVRLTGLSPSTAYTIEVAAVNGAGVGAYSNPTNQSTFGIIFFC